jgi:Na+-translocating ferredoxin:NAD+ oxidoreductase RNF subunit RnfB
VAELGAVGNPVCQWPSVSLGQCGYEGGEVYAVAFAVFE